jgi:hypothetical protein
MPLPALMVLDVSSNDLGGPIPNVRGDCARELYPLLYFKLPTASKHVCKAMQHVPHNCSRDYWP